MRISISKSEATVLSEKKVDCLLRVGSEVLPQVEESECLGVLFTSGSYSVCSNVDSVPICCGEQVETVTELYPAVRKTRGAETKYQQWMVFL